MSSFTTFVIFGASGDLTARKLIPALFDNFCKGRLPENLKILGVSRTPMSDDEFREKVKSATECALGCGCKHDCWAKFASRIHYCPADGASDSGYPTIENAIRDLEPPEGGGRVYYMSLGPELFPKVIEQLGKAGMADQQDGWRRVVFEKPFGVDYESARELNQKIHAVFDESQVYRIDHYLGKETVQNLLVLRFANAIFEPIWNRNYIDNVQINVAESVDIGTRGGYYDTSGVVRDMFQNHILQILALIAMEAPSRFAAHALRDEKIKVLEAIHIPTPDEVATSSVLAQYDDYHQTQGVDPESRTPTYAALRFNIDNWRWKGVPFYLRSGKAMPAKTTEAIVQFLSPPHMIFNVPKVEMVQCNQLVMTIQPDEGIHISFQTKVPDQGMELQESKLYFHYHDSYSQLPIPDSYERLLLDAIKGDASLFISQEEIERSWQLVDPFIQYWSDPSLPPLPKYARKTWGPAEADTFIGGDNRCWINGASLHHD